MAGPDSYPPPGAEQPRPAAPPAYAPPAYAPPTYAPPPPGWAPGPGMLGAAHKPGAIPLRPLGLGDMYDAAFRIIRFNPKATVGSSVLVAAVAMAIPILVTSVLTWTVDLSLAGSGADLSNAEAVGLVGSMASLGLGTILQSIGLILVTGMIAHVTAAAAVGRRLTLGEAWRATHGKRWRLIGLAALLGLMMLGLLGAYALTWLPVVLGGELAVIVGYGLLTGPLFLALLVWFWIRVYYLPVPALMLEPVGVTGAIGRGFRLTRGQFWRTFGIALLTVVIANVAGSMLSLPATLLGPLVAGAFAPQYALLGLVLTNAFTAVVAAAFAAPFTTAVTSVQYLDQRMRKEAYDVELMARAGIPRS
jgi:hypothetical protein